MGEIYAWHFVGKTLRNGDRIPPDGVTLAYPGKLHLCKSGLHASKRVVDALRYAPGNTLCRVACGGRVVHDTDKLVCSRRRIIWRRDATSCLRAFARWCALQVVDLWDAPPVVLEYLQIGDESPRAAARAAARDVAWDAARDVAWDAAMAATWDAASTAARAAARDAAMAAARAAARDVAWDAASTAARAAAWYAARDAQQEHLTAMLEEMRHGKEEWTWEIPKKEASDDRC